VLAGLLDCVLLSLQRLRIDDRAHEVLEVGDVAHLDVAHLLGEPLAQLGPEVRGRVDRARRPSISAPGNSKEPRTIAVASASTSRGGVRDDEVLAAGLRRRMRG